MIFMPKYISILGGNPSRSSGKTTGNYFTIVTDLREGTLALESLTQTK